MTGQEYVYPNREEFEDEGFKEYLAGYVFAILSDIKKVEQLRRGVT